MASKGASDSGSGQSDKDRADLEEQIYAEHRSIPKHLREKVLERDGHRCRIKGCRGRAHNGSAQLLVQRIEQEATSETDPELTELETRCLRCSVWIAQMPTTEDLRPRIKQRLGGVTLEPNRAEILQYLGEEGPATTGEILENVNLSSKPGVRQALYSLMALDVSESAVERVLVKDRVEQTYGLPWQVPDEHDARGVIPVRPAELRNRILDELVNRLCQQLEDKVEEHEEVIAGIVKRNPRQIGHMRRRAEAFQFPFEEWADREQSREDPTAIIVAVDALADESNNLSRQLVSRNIAGVYEANDEQSSANLLRAYAESKDITPYIEEQSRKTDNADGHSSEEESVSADDGSRSETGRVETSSSREDSPRWDLQTLQDASLESEESDVELGEFDPEQANSVGDGDSDE